MINDVLTDRMFNKIKEFELTKKDLSRIYNIPYDTIRRWASNKGSAPIYVSELVLRSLDDSMIKYTRDDMYQIPQSGLTATEFLQHAKREHGLTKENISHIYGIPMGTINGWISKTYEPPRYILNLLFHDLPNASSLFAVVPNKGDEVIVVEKKDVCEKYLTTLEWFEDGHEIKHLYEIKRQAMEQKKAKKNKKNKISPG